MSLFKPHVSGRYLMKLRTDIVVAILLVLFLAPIRVESQANDIVNILSDFEARAAAGNPRSPEEAEPVFESFARATKENVATALPTIIQKTTSSQVSVRRVAAVALFVITRRPDLKGLLSPYSGTFAALLVDPDIPIRRMTGLSLDNLHLDQTSTLIPNLVSYLSRKDAVSTIGGGIAGLLMKAAPDNSETTDAIVRYMRRNDHTPESRSDMLQSIDVTRNHNLAIGRAVASYAADPDEQVSTHAIRTIRGMGDSVVSDNQKILSAIAEDPKRGMSVREAARNALSK